MAERQVLQDPIGVRGMHRLGAPERAAAFGNFGFRQMAAAGAGAQDFSTGRDLKTFGHGFLGLDAFGTSHNPLSKKSAQYKDLPPRLQGIIFAFGRA